eukprot:2040595-Rhodomonas_salina.2
MSTLVANFLTDAYAEANAQCADWIRVAPVLRKYPGTWVPRLGTQVGSRPGYPGGSLDLGFTAPPPLHPIPESSLSKQNFGPTYRVLFVCAQLALSVVPRGHGAYCPTVMSHYSPRSRHARPYATLFSARGTERDGAECSFWRRWRWHGRGCALWRVSSQVRDRLILPVTFLSCRDLLIAAPVAA